MPFEATELRISLQKLLVGLVLVIVPLSIAGLYITNQSDHSLEQTVGSEYGAVAQSARADVLQFVNDRILDCRLIARQPTVIDALATANRSQGSAGDAALKQRIERLRKNWNAADSDPTLKAILASPVSHLLRQHRDLDPRFLRITVADQRGLTVAATDKPVDYLQAEEGYWPEVYADGQGGVTVRNVLYHAGSRSTYIGVAVPVLDQDSHMFSGAVYALVDVSGLLQQITREPASRTAKMIIAKEDGTVVLSPGLTLANNMKSEEYAVVRDALATVRGRQAGYVVADLAKGKRQIVGFADFNAAPANGSLGWIIMASEGMREATSPVRAVGDFALAMVMFGLLMLTLTAVYVFLHRREEFDEIETLDETRRQVTSA